VTRFRRERFGTGSPGGAVSMGLAWTFGGDLPGIAWGKGGVLARFLKKSRAAAGKLGFCCGGGVGRAKCQMGWSTLQSMACGKPLKAARRRLATTATYGAMRFAAKVTTWPLPSFCVAIAGDPSEQGPRISAFGSASAICRAWLGRVRPRAQGREQPRSGRSLHFDVDAKPLQGRALIQAELRQGLVVVR